MADVQQVTRVAGDAASSPFVVTNASVASVTTFSQWLTTGPGLATAFTVGIAICSFLMQLWLGLRKDRREQREHELKVLEALRGDRHG